MTISENIALALAINKVPAGSVEPSILDIAGKLNISDMLNKYPYQVSGGQKQRITIARALIKNSPILILDDSASALDYATDANLRRAIKENTDSQTVIIVSQRVNSVKDADRIAVMDDGEIVGIGTHKDLVDTCDIYREICYSQEQLD